MVAVLAGNSSLFKSLAAGVGVGVEVLGGGDDDIDLDVLNLWGVGEEHTEISESLCGEGDFEGECLAEPEEDSLDLRRDGERAGEGERFLFSATLKLSLNTGIKKLVLRIFLLVLI